MYASVPGIRATYTKESQAFRGVHLKYFQRLAVYSISTISLAQAFPDGSATAITDCPAPSTGNGGVVP